MSRDVAAIWVSGAMLLLAAGLWLGLKRLAVEVDGASFIAILNGRHS